MAAAALSLRLSLPAALAAGLAPGLAAQLVPPADGQLPFPGSAWNGDAECTAAVDVNADGYPDLIRADSALAVALNNGHAVFATVDDGALPAPAHSSACGDLDGDGHVDLVLASQSGAGSVTTLRGDGTGHFTVLQTRTLSGPGELALADFDLDGRLDLVAGSTGPAFSFQTLAGLGDGTLDAPVPHGSFASTSDIDTADWNRDGNPDVLAGSSVALCIFLGDGAGAFSNGPTVVIGFGWQARLADIDADGWPDLLDGAQGLEPLVAYWRNVAGSLAMPLTYDVYGAKLLAVEQDPADGFPDVVAADEDTVTLLANHAGQLEAKWQNPVTVDMHGVAIADFDGNDEPDLVAGGAVLFAAEDGSVDTALTISLVLKNAQAIALGQLDGGGPMDLVVADHDASKLRYAHGTNSVDPKVSPFDAFWGSVATIPAPIDVGLADANGDGNLDAVVLGGLLAHVAGGLAVNPGDGVALLPEPLVTPLDAPPTQFALGDVDGDGRIDAAVLEGVPSAERFRSWLGTGAGGFTPGGQVSLGAGAERAVLGDVDGDGALDAVATRGGPGAPAGGELLVCHGDGLGGFGAPVVVPQSVHVFRDVVTGDFDADGRQDIAAACLVGGGVALFRNTGAGGFDAPVVGGFVVPGENGLIATDIDQDGALDLVHAGLLDAAVYVIRGDGHGGLHSATAHPCVRGGGLRTVAAARLGGDSMPDLLQLGMTEGALAVLRSVEVADNSWASIGGGIAGVAGQPRASGTGTPGPFAFLDLALEHAAPDAPAVLVLGTSLLGVPFKGGWLAPSPDLVVALPPQRFARHAPALRLLAARRAVGPRPLDAGVHQGPGRDPRPVRGGSGAAARAVKPGGRLVTRRRRCGHPG